MMISGEVPGQAEEVPERPGQMYQSYPNASGEIFVPNLLDLAVQELSRCLISLPPSVQSQTAAQAIR